MDPDPLSFLCMAMPGFIPAVSDYVLTAILLLIIIINAIISGSEVAFFTIQQNRHDGYQNLDDNPRKARVIDLLNKPEKLLTSIVITYNLLNITITALSIYLLNRLPFFSGRITEFLILEIIIVICVIILFVDIFPKFYASHNPTRFASNHSLLIGFINRIMNPITSLLLKSNGLFSRSAAQVKQEISVDDLSKALEITSNETTRDQEKEMLEGIIRFRDKSVDDIKMSRSDMVAINAETVFFEVISFIVDAGFSRIPVFDENPDNIRGILYVKDLLPHLGKPADFGWQSLIRSAYFVPGSKRIDDLLEEFRNNKIHMAIVVDEYGGTSGLVTMEDILEEIVGDISDEYDEELPFYSMAPDGSYIFEGKTHLEDFIKITNVPEKDFEIISDEVDTLAGLLLELKGDFPKRKESLTYKKYTFLAEEMSKKRIVKVRYIPPKTTR
ncbi:MAG: gliding motility-associated protein GldE [Candidatus Hydrogenedentes bacterium]|nr:gliding motility-associated protein GldE [Candidatus Hydrogenedentota bacterium]